MKAVVCSKYGPPEVLRIVEKEQPIPKDNEVLVRVHATTVTAADYRVRSFNVPASFWIPGRLALGLRKPRNPVLGMELAGEIEAIGKKVSRFKIGDQVFAATLQSFGAYAEYICIAEDGPIALKPSGLTYEAAAAIPIGARTALYYLKNVAYIKPGHKVLIYGASGSVGTYAVQLAKYFGADVTGVCSTANMDLVKSIGADIVMDYTLGNVTDGFKNYDIIFDTVDKCSFIACRKALKKHGYYLNIGRPIPSPHMIWTALSTSLKVVVGKNAPESKEALDALKAIIEAGYLTPVIDSILSLDEIVEAHRYADKGHKKGNLVISIS